jgi:type IV secretion system protein TrbH
MTMRKHLVTWLLLALMLGGCAAQRYGNFVAKTQLDQARLAGDVVRQLVAMYPPAKTRLELQQPTPDPFGQALVQSLRAEGYALREFHPKAVEAATSSASAGGSASAGAVPLRYVLDQAGETSLFHLTLLVGTQALTRPYQAQNGTFSPVGYWVRKE